MFLFIVVPLIIKKCIVESRSFNEENKTPSNKKQIVVFKK